MYQHLQNFQKIWTHQTTQTKPENRFYKPTIWYSTCVSKTTDRTKLLHSTTHICSPKLRPRLYSKYNIESCIRDIVRGLFQITGLTGQATTQFFLSNADTSKI